MNNYKVLVSGLGIEAFLFLLPQQDSDLVHSLDLSLPFSQLAQLLEIGGLDGAQACLRGVWLDSISVEVSLDNAPIWSHYKPACELETYDCSFEETVLSHQNNISGDLLIFEFRSPDFQWEELRFLATYIGGRAVVTGLIYGGEYLDSPDDYLEWECDWSQTFIIWGSAES